ncbi:MAG: hypothetical protein ACMXYG_04075 [Candidatus Woesearchaeota archaeon]
MKKIIFVMLAIMAIGIIAVSASTLQSKNRVMNEEMKYAIEANDYDAWFNARPDNPNCNNAVTQENWETFVAMHNAKQAGDIETVKELAEELGLSPRMQHKKIRNNYEFRNGMGKETCENPGTCELRQQKTMQNIQRRGMHR